MRRKVAAVWISLLIMVSSVVILVEIAERVEAPTTLYVGGGGGGNYSKIQDAINDSNDGDTVFVYNGTYIEKVVVNKTINLTGENKNTTIIDGGGDEDVIHITADGVKLTNFSVKGSGSDNTWVTVLLSSVQNCLVSNINVSVNGRGIVLWESHNNTISHNTIIGPGMISGIWLMSAYESTYNTLNNNFCSGGWDGLYLLSYTAHYNHIHNNTFTQNRNGIVPYGEYNIITHNNFTNNQYGFFASGLARRNIISYNNITDNDNGIYLSSTYDHTIFRNNFINNTNQAHDSGNNDWDDGYPTGGNYWSDYTGEDNYYGPNQDIPGSDGIGDTYHPVSGGSNVDNYPLMEPSTYIYFENYLYLKQGWNLISIPIIQEEENLTSVLGTIDGLYDAVQWYDVSDSIDPWKHNKIGKPFGNDLVKLNETMSFWIHITQAGDTIFVYNGTQSTSNQTIQLHPGWNMVGYPSLTSYNRTTGLNNLTFDTHVDAIQWYDAASKTWHFMGPTDNFVPGRGYWVHSKVDVEWEVPL